MIDPTLFTGLAAAMEHAVTTALRYDPGTRAALARLDGKVIALYATTPSLQLYLLPSDDATPLSIQTQCEREVDLTLKGSMTALIGLMSGPRHSLADSGVSASGSTALLSELQGIVVNLDIDWEEPLTDVLGPVGGHALANMLRTQWQRGRSRTRKAQGFAGEYLTEELRITPTNAELEAFFSDISAVREATERLQARLAHLEQRSPSPPADAGRGD